MANNAKVTLTFDIQEDGSLKLVTKNLNDLNKATQNNSKVARDAGKANDELNYKLNQGSTGVSSAARSFSKLNQAIGAGPNGLVGAYATLAANAFAVSAAFNTLREAAQVEQLMKGLEIQGNRTGVTLKQTAQEIVKITNGALGAADAMRSTALMSSAGLVKSDMEALTKIATDASVALGRNLPDAMDRITKGVVKLEPELLDELGLMTKLTEASNTYARQNHKTATSLTAVEKRTAFLQAIQREGALKFGGIVDEAGVNQYDRLAATFDNLSKQTISWISNLGPLEFVVKSLADSTTTLGGALILFASTISRSLMGSLYNLHESLDKQAQKLEKVARKQKAVTEATLADTKANVEAARAGLEDPTKALDKRGATAFKADFSAMKEGTLTQEKYQTNIDKLTSSSARFGKELDSLYQKQKQGIPVDSARIERLETVILIREDQIAQIRRLKAAEEELAILTKSTAEDQKQAAITTAAAAKTGAASTALEAAGNFELKKSVGAIRESVKSYADELRTKAMPAGAEMGAVTATSFGGVKKAFDAAKVAGYGLGLSIKAIGTAFLAALPYIGLATTAIGLIVDLWKKWTTTEAERKITEAYEALSTVLDSVEGKLKEIDRLKNLDISTSQRTTKTLQIQANAISEIGQAYQEVRQARERAAENDAAEQRLYERNQQRLADAQQNMNMMMAAGGTPVYIDLAEQATSKTRELANATNTLVDSDITSWFAENTKGIDTTNQSVRTTIRVLDSLSRIDRQVAEEFRNAADAAEDQNGVMRVADQIIAKYTDSNTSLVGALLSLTSAYESAELAQENFIKSISTTTVYDQSLTAIDSLNQALGQTSKLLNRPEDTQKFAEMLGTLGPNLRETLDVETQKRLEEADSLGDQYNNISKFLSDHRDLLGDINDKTSQAYRLDSERKGIQWQIQAIYREQQDTIRQQLSDYADRLAQAQKESTLAQGRLALAQAELEVMTRNGVITAQQMREQLRQQNAIKDQQAASLRINIEFLNIEIQKEEAQLRKLRDERKSIINQHEILDVMERQSIVMSSTLLDAEAAAIRQAQVVDRSASEDTQRTRETRLAEIARLTEENTQVLNGQGEAWERYSQRALRDLDLEEQALNRTISARRASIQGINMQAEAILRTKISEREITLRAQELNIRNNSQTIKATNQLNDLENDRNRLLRERAKILTGLTSDIGDEIAEAITNASRQLRSLVADTATELAELERQRDLTTDAGAKAVLQTQIDLLKERYTYSLRNLEISYQNQLIQATTIDTLKEGLERQRDSLKVMEDYLKLQQQINVQKAEQRSLDAQIAAKRAGREVSPEVQRNLEIIAAREALQTAEDGLAIKIEGINLEYALLEAQRLNTIFQYRLQKEALNLSLQASGRTREEAETMLGQMDSAIGRLETMSYDRVRDMAVDSARREVDILQRRLVLAETRPIPGLQDTGIPDMLGAINDFTRIITTRNLVPDRITLVPGSSVIPDMVKTREDMQKQLTADVSTLTTQLRTEFLPTAQEALEALTALVQTIRTNETPGRILSTDTGVQVSNRPTDLKMKSDAWSRPVREATVEFARVAQEGLGDVFNRFTAFNDWGPMSHRNPAAGHGAGVKFDLTVVGGAAASREAEARLHELARQNGYIIEVLNEYINPSPGSTGGHLDVKVLGRAEQPRQRAAAAPVAPTTPTPAPASIAIDSAESEDTITVVGERLRSIVEDKPLYVSLNIDDLLKDLPSIDLGLEKVKVKFEDVWNFATQAAQPLLNTLRSLGPEGEAQARAIEGIQSLGTIVGQNIGSITQSYDEYKKQIEETNVKLAQQGRTQIEVADQGTFHAQKLSEGFAVAAAAIGSIMSILSASSDAKLARIDKEIAAEQKRDGKSKESLARIDAMEKKKDSIARKQFNTNKKLMMAQAVMSTAAGIAGALAASPVGPWNIALAAMIGAMGAAQIAIIGGTQYESSYSPKAVEMPSSLSIGKRSDSINLAMGPNANAGGEVGYLRGAAGTGTSASNYNAIGSAYGGDLSRGYGNRGFIVGEKGPELITPETPINVTPANENVASAPVNATINIQAIDSQGVQDVLVAQKGNIIQMLRQAANANGQRFLEDVNVNVYTRPSVGKLL